MSALGIVITHVLHDRLLRFGAGPEVFPMDASTLTVPLADSIGELSQQSPLRLMETVMPRALSPWR